MTLNFCYSLLKLTTIIIAPALLGLLGSFFYGKFAVVPENQNDYDKLTSFKDKFIFIFKPHPQYNLLLQPSLCLSILVPFFYFIGVGSVIWSGYYLDISSRGLITFWGLSTFPFSIFALSIPLSVLVARIHSSEQVSKKIQLTEARSNFELFYMHKEKFMGHFENYVEIPEFINQLLDGSPLFRPVFLSSVYTKLFPENKPTQEFSPKWNKDFISELKNFRNGMQSNLLLYAKSKNLDEAPKNYSKLKSETISFFCAMGAVDLTYKFKHDGTHYIKQGENALPDSYTDFSINEWISLFDFGSTIYSLICSFCHIDLHEYTTFTYIGNETRYEFTKNRVLDNFRNLAMHRKDQFKNFNWEHPPKYANVKFN